MFTQFLSDQRWQFLEKINPTRIRNNFCQENENCTLTYLSDRSCRAILQYPRVHCSLSSWPQLQGGSLWLKLDSATPADHGANPSPWLPWDQESFSPALRCTPGLQGDTEYWDSCPPCTWTRPPDSYTLVPLRSRPPHHCSSIIDCWNRNQHACNWQDNKLTLVSSLKASQQGDQPGEPCRALWNACTGALDVGCWKSRLCVQHPSSPSVICTVLSW